MIKLSTLFQPVLVLFFLLLWGEVHGQTLGAHIVRTPRQDYQQNPHRRQQNGNNNNNGKKDTSAFNIVNGQILTPGLAILDAPQPFTPMGGDFLHIAIDVSGNGKLPVPPRAIDDPLTQFFNITLFLTSNVLLKNFTISNITTSTPPFANIMDQESGQTVKHINFEWPDCLVGDGKEDIGTTARGEYNISIHQNFRLNGSDHYSIFNLPISVTNSISQFPGAGQLLTKPPPGPLNANGGRMSCEMISNRLRNITELVNSVNNPPGQPYQDIAIETTAKNQGGQVGGPGTTNNGGGGNIGNNGGNAQGVVGAGTKAFKGRVWDSAAFAAVVTLATTVTW
ncbi:uncharacterized protein BDR25DRAFT_276031 [Lindgomyces ingoldianus]|uniref:Uncharacterized protein n=1 Tax=Lindgomyces ingoldianus TaxID=673940 RepID=A0ACB6RIP4_9PLEO|nr:uncharacterized protein BDR25DRAFT_276031 [Lindgomyces ingoldianus]KAF2478205.1 hypothetical protein BDR25DRAFT_276031 [Lindgomyces ingoldianus]